AFDRNFPVRMLAKEAADDPQPNRLVGGRRHGHVERLVSSCHDLADSRTKLRLQLAIIVALVWEIKRLMCADGIDECCGSTSALELRTERRKPAGISRAPFVDLDSACIDRPQLGDALRELGFQKIRSQGESSPKVLPRLSD